MYSMKNKRLWILLGGLILVGLAFLFLNFRVAVSNTQSNKLVATTDSGDKMQVPMQRNEKISMVLVGNSQLIRALQDRLTEQLERAGMGEIELAQELKQTFPNPVLVVKVGQPGPIWTPFLAMSKFSVHAGYASNGDATYMEIMEATHTSIASPDPAVLKMYAEYDVDDLSFGLISRQGYHQYLADYFAQEIIAALKNLYKI